MWNSITLWVLALYISLFVWQTLRHKQWLWLWAAVLCWLAVAVWGARVLPGVLGPNRLANAYTPYLYIGFTSFLIWLPLGGVWSGNGRRLGGDYLRLLAITGLLQHASLLVLGLLIVWSYPHGLALYAAPALLYQYGLQPVWWIGSQWLVMGLCYGLNRYNGKPGYAMDRVHAQGVFLLFLLLQTGFVVLDLLARFG